MRITRHTELEVFKRAFDLAMKVFNLSKVLPPEERSSLTDQIPRSSKPVCSNIAEGWRKGRYEAAFISKLSDSEGEAAETQVWLQFAVQCEHLDRELFRELCSEYDEVISMLGSMIHNANDWTLKGDRESRRLGEKMSGRASVFHSPRPISRSPTLLRSRSSRTHSS